jgi:hypothetical protein
VGDQNEKNPESVERTADSEIEKSVSFQPSAVFAPLERKPTPSLMVSSFVLLNFKLEIAKN